jgi:hypothetical protein
MVELTLNWNHVTQVLGPNGNITYPAQLLPLMIGALSFLRICWVLFKRWQFPEQDCCDESQVGQQRTGMSRRAPFTTPQVGLGLLSPPSAHLKDTYTIVGQEYNTSMIRNKSSVKRYLVAYLPWVSQFDFWKTPKGQRNPQGPIEEDGKIHHDSALTAVGMSHKEVEYTDLHATDVLSSTNTSPMIDMKLPTSAPPSPMMSHSR